MRFTGEQVAIHGLGAGPHDLEGFAAGRDRRPDEQEDQAADHIAACQAIGGARDIQTAGQAEQDRHRAGGRAAKRRGGDDRRHEDQEGQPLLVQRRHDRAQHETGSGERDRGRKAEAGMSRRQHPVPDRPDLDRLRWGSRHLGLRNTP